MRAHYFSYQVIEVIRGEENFLKLLLNDIKDKPFHFMEKIFSYLNNQVRVNKTHKILINHNYKMKIFYFFL